ncbi:hypothetical protein Bbelb_155770 [Branchiostoma belcheri]|nr:hypothetical protein Bbelb_155770 [Branchiostoma belcheri]
MPLGETLQLMLRSQFKKGALPNGTWTETGGLPDGCRPIFGPARSCHGTLPASLLKYFLRHCSSTFESRPSVTFATHQFCLPLFFSYQCQKTYIRQCSAYICTCSKTREEPVGIPQGTRQGTDSCPAELLEPVGTLLHVYAEDMPNGCRFKCDLSIRKQKDRMTLKMFPQPIFPHKASH